MHLNCRSSTPPPSSHTIHHLPYSSLNDHSLQSSPSSILSSNSQIVSHQIVLMNPNERISSSSSSINSMVNSTSLKDLLSSQQPTQKQQFAIPTIPSIVQTSNMNLPKTSYTTNKILNNSTDDGLYLRYEREQPSNQNSFHFSYIIDEYSSSIPKRSRYVSINDL
ncbi:unnamed protein product [Adineta steineri]|uniref:Uncharacterized protein n=1 Tax=Adineta steineri TaxID=433720 RepID=A0A813Z2P3_9BILA|nr:unnamed protein product [Adineta steineri]